MGEDVTAALGPYLVACTALVLAGAAKARRPHDTARALVALRPGTALGPLSLGVRVGAALEAALGVVGALWPRPVPAALVAVSYLSFAGFVALARRRGGVLATCGCFGTPDTPATRFHVVVDLALGAAAVVVGGAGAGSGAGDLVVLLGRQPLDGAPLVASALLGTALVLLALTALARLGQSRALLAGVPQAGTNGTGRA